METPAPNPCRSPRPGVSTALIVGLLIGVTMASLRPSVSTASRDGAAQRIATRHLAQSLARVVRELSTEKDKPALTVVRLVRDDSMAAPRERTPCTTPVARTLLRESLLALPPPVA